MATIYPRKNRNGSISWRVMFRRVGIKPFITAFSSKEEAEDFCEDYEELYCLDPESFTWDKLNAIRKREFNFKNQGF